MEIILELLFQLFGELILGLIGQAIGAAFDGLFSRVSTRSRAAVSGASGAMSPVAKFLLYLFASALLGWASLQVFPASFLKVPDTRIAALIGVPMACGLAMAAMGEFRRKRGRPVRALESFSHGLAFALPMALIRYFWAS